LELEITESAVMQDPMKATEILRSLKNIGVRIALDDFGTGYSSLNYLKHFPIDVVKIDQSFVRDLVSDPDDMAITRAVIAMSHGMRHVVIAEGVETQAQFEVLRSNGCDLIQGYLFSRPVPPEQFLKLIAEYATVPMELGANLDALPTLLVVDDEESVLAVFRRIFRRDGYRLLTATNAKDAFEVLATHTVQVVISDKLMPNMDGIEFLSRVKAMYPDTVRIVLSGYTEVSAVTDAVNRGSVFKFLTKPWDDDALRSHVREAFAHYDGTRKPKTFV
jgi:CheY-like chemotaxis protein